jgi:hypothetical protein
MEERLKPGTSTKSERLSKLDTTTKIGISRAQEKLQICRSGALTLNGSKSSNIRTNTLSIQQTKEFSMLCIQKMKKVKQSEFLLEMRKLKVEQPTRDGRLSILIKLHQLDLKDLTKSSVSTSIDHSISDQECQ